MGPHAELMLAADPTDSLHLLAGGIDLGAGRNRTQVSTNGGYRWAETTPGGKHRYEWEGADPQVAFDARGTAYFISMDHVAEQTIDSTSSWHGGLHLYRSEDGGFNWSEPVTADAGFASDHPQLVIDKTGGKYNGRIYIGAAPMDLSKSKLTDLESKHFNISVFRSDDGGRTFMRPVEAVKPRAGGQGIVIQVRTPVVLRDGTLFVGAVDLYGTTSKQIWRVISRDGGDTFSELGKVQAITVDSSTRIRASAEHLPVFVIDTTAHFPDRIYCVWNDERTRKLRIFMSYSDDAGTTWSAPKQVDARVPATAEQFLPAATVNKNGVLGISWYDTRHKSAEGRPVEYFTASLDGGATFLPAARVSARDARRVTAQISMSALADESTADTLRLRFNMIGDWPGHYQGLTSTASGVFQAFWVDLRSGSAQIWSSQILVTTTPPIASSALEKRNVTSRVKLVFDPVMFDATGKEVVVPMRLENTSASPIHRPLTAEVILVGGLSPIATTEIDTKYSGGLAARPIILNAPNGKPGAGAVFDFSDALGDFDALPPGARTSPVILRAKLPQPPKSWAHLLNFRVTGRTAR
jgi:hypothetical protein